MANTQCIEPIVGDWYRSHGQLFEVVAVDDTEGIVEVQHADGDLEEMDMDDWSTRCRAGSLRMAKQPEDSRLSTDRDDDEDASMIPGAFDEIRGLRADSLGDLDLFD
jgi:hypothetical protein